jgi:AcrR family transcriptional regulator
MMEQIIDTALQQFLQHGIRKTTVQKLITPLGISTKTFYKYFADKEDILTHCVLRHYAELSRRLSSLQGENRDPLLAMVELWRQAIVLDFGVNHVFYHDLNYYYPKIQDSVLRKFSAKYIRLLSELTASCIRMGYFRKEIIPALVPKIIGILYSSITRTGEFKSLKLSTDQLMQNTIDPYIRGICSVKGLKTLSKII